MLEKALQRDVDNRPFEDGMRKFGEMALSDHTLLEQLDKTPDKQAFIEKYLSLARSKGFNFTMGELEVAVQEQKQGSNWVIPKQILRMIADRF